jgi:hypothetical protein
MGIIATMIGNGHTMLATKFGSLKCEVTQVKGSKFEFRLKGSKLCA